MRPLLSAGVMTCVEAASESYLKRVLFKMRELGTWNDASETQPRRETMERMQLWRLVPRLRRGAQAACAVEKWEQAFRIGPLSADSIAASCGPVLPPKVIKKAIAACSSGAESLLECRELMYLSFLVLMFAELDVFEYLARMNRRGIRMPWLPDSPRSRFRVQLPLARPRWDVLSWLLQGRGRGQRVAEIGVRAGDTAKRLLRLPEIVQYIAIDPYRQPEWGWDMRLWNRTRARLTPIGRGRIEWMLMTSQDAASFVPPGSLDLVFVDGLHDLANALGDCMAWGPKLRPDGILAGHDFSLEHPPVMVAAIVCCRLRNSTVVLTGDNVWYC